MGEYWAVTLEGEKSGEQKAQPRWRQMGRRGEWHRDSVALYKLATTLLPNCTRQNVAAGRYLTAKQTDRQTERQRDRHTDRHTDRHRPAGTLPL